MQVLYISRQNSETFDISHAFLPLTVEKLLTLINSLVFLAHPVYIESSTKYWAPLSKKVPNSSKVSLATQ